jgi:hypothetical protein
MATSKQFGLRGIGSDVQLGKAGGRFVFDGTDFNMTGTDGSTLVNVSGAEPTLGTHLTTKNYVDSVSSGLDPKESVRVATTANIDLGTGGLLTIDGVTLQAGDRVLVKDQTTATENGIYVAAAGAWSRSEDMDGTPASEVSGGNFTFVEQGTANINSGWVVQGDGILTLGTNAITWVQFSGAGSITAGVALTKVGETLNVDLFDGDVPNQIPTMTATVDSADLLMIGDTSESTTLVKSVGDVLNDLDVPQFPAFAQSALITRTADDVYVETVFGASTTAGQEGLVFNASNTAPSFGLNIDGLTGAGTLTGAEEIAVFDGNNNVKASINDIIADRDLVTAADALTGMVQITGGVLTSTSVTASSAANRLGIDVQNGGTAPVVGLNINGLTGTTLELTDELAVYSTSNATNEKATIQNIVDLVAANSSDNEISEGDSSVTVTDAGTGTITTTVDNTVVMTATAGGVDVTSLTVDSLTAGQVVYAGTDGLLTTEAGFEYNDTTDTLSAANISATTSGTFASAAVSDLTSGRVVLAGTAGELEDSADLTFNGTNLVVGGTAGLQVAGNIATTSGSITAAGGLIDSTLSVNNGVVTTNASGALQQSANFTFDGSTMTIAGDVDITGSLDVDNIAIDGNTISSTDTDGDIIIAPNGNGEVIIGNAGSPAQLIAEDDQSLTVAGGAGTSTAGGDLNLFGGDGAGAIDGGDVTIQAGSSASGTAGTTLFLDANDNVVAQILNSAASTDGTLDLSAGASIAASGTAANIDITLDPKGTGTVIVGDEATYSANMVDASLTTKAYLDSQISANVVPGSLASVSGTIDLSSAGAQNIGAADGIPANATILEVTMDVTAASNAATTVTFGDSSNGAASYMADTENDPETTGLYIGDARVTNGGTAQQAQATVATPGASGSAFVVITFRNA